MSFQDLDIQVRYRSNVNEFVPDFLLPVLEQTDVYKRAVGFFSSSALVELSVGLFDLAKRGGTVQLVCSPELDEAEIEAIELGYKTREEAINRALITSILEPVNVFEEERLNLIATMIANKTLDIRLAFMEDFTGTNMYHEKIAIFTDAYGNKISHTGSLNESVNAFDNNFESIYTFCSFKDESQQEAVKAAETDFDQLWNNSTEKLEVIPFPEIVIEKLLTFKKDTVDYSIEKKQFNILEYRRKKIPFSIPAFVNLRDYQETAICGWFEQDCKGLFSICTGGGKTWTALACMVKLAEQLKGELAVFILCPYVHLVSQWEEDICNWGPNPIVAHSKSSQKDWFGGLKSASRKFKQSAKPFICVTTNETFASDKFQSIIDRFDESDNVLIICDEAHNMGSRRLSSLLPNNIRYRIGLSATIKRHMDNTGTKALFEYFGEECIRFDIENAIDLGALCHYDYHPIPVCLTEAELSQYHQITKQLKKYIIIEDGIPKISEAGKLLVFKRNRILAGARNKIELILNLLEEYKEEDNILVYCGAAMTEDDDSYEARQIDIVTKRIKNELHMSVRRFTADESLQERQEIKRYFSTGQYQVITAIKCLDEGVNIPGIKTAFIMSSTRNPKEFIQRRGRLLRKSGNKEKAVIYDFVTLPRDLDMVVNSDYEYDKSIIIGELARIDEFGKLSDNYTEAELMKNKIMECYGVYIDIDSELEKMEVEYAD